MSDEPEKLSILERRFCEAYAGECAGNGVRAAEVAGYSGSYGVLATTASRLLKKAEIREYLDSLIEHDPLAMKRIERVRQLSRIGRGEYTETKFNEEGKPYEVHPPAKDIIAAIKELGLLAGDYVTKVAHTDSKGEDVKSLSITELYAMAQMGKGE